MTIDQTLTPASTRIVDGTELPVPGTWSLDPGHTSVEFIGRHLMLTRIRGRVAGVSGTVTVGEEPTDSTVSVVLDMASVDSGNAQRDAHLRSADFLDVERHPIATFTGGVRELHGGLAVVRGDLEIVGVRRPVDLDVTFVGGAEDPWGNRRAVFSAATEIDREEWGLSWNLPLPDGGLLVSKQIRIEIESELVLDA